MKIYRTWYDYVTEAGCLLLLIGTSIYLAVVWGDIPSEISGHYNAFGQIDKYSGKGSLIPLLLVVWIIYLGMSVIEKFPQVWNTGIAVTAENKNRIYRILKDMLKTMKFLVVAVFTYLIFNSIFVLPLSPWFLPVSLVLIFGSLTFFIIKLFINR